MSNKNIGIRNWRICVLAGLCFGGATPVSALDTSLSIGTGVQHTNNSLKANLNEQSDLKSVSNLGLGLEYEGPALTASVDYDARYTAFDKNTQEDETRVGGNAALAYEQFENLLTWTLKNSRRSVLKDKALNDIESNREDRSISSIGAQFKAKPSGRDSLFLDVSYTDLSYEDSGQQDSDRTGAGLSWTRALTKVDTLTLATNFQEVSYDDTNFEYDYYRATIGYSAKLSKLTYSLNAGINESQRDQGDTEGLYLSANAVYDYNATTYTFSAVHELTDTSQGNNNVSNGDFNGTSNNVDIFERSNMEFGASNQLICASCTVSVFVFWEEEDYEEVQDDSEEIKIGLNFGYQLSRTLDLRAKMSFSDMNFINGNPRSDFERTRYGLRLNQKLIRDWSMDWYINYDERSSDQSLRDYDELAGGVNIRYSFN